MRRSGVAALIAATGMLTVLIVATAPAQDASVPSWMASRVAAGRASLLQHVDLVQPGSSVVLTGAHCRDDGAVRLLYRNRYLWLVERRYFADAPAGWSSGSMGGGVLADREDPLTTEEWVAGYEEVDCAVPPAGDLTRRCDAGRYSIGYPDAWFVHPADPAEDLAPCSHFAAAPFNIQREDDYGVVGAQVTIWAGVGCRGSFDRVLSQLPTTVDSRPAYRNEVERGEGGPEPRAVEIIVNVRDPVPCETSAWIVGRTESDDPGAFEENVGILEAMMLSLDLDRWR